MGDIMKALRILVALLTVSSMSFGTYALAADKNVEKKSKEKVTEKATKTTEVSDSTITKEVKEKLSADKMLAPLKIDIETKQGVVSLKGDVQTSSEANTAVEITQSVAGVKDVKTDHLKVEGSAHPFTDAYITAKVKGVFLRDKLFGDKPISVTGIHVETKDGVVHLTGTVDDEMKAKDAEELTKTVKDVKGVKSSIKIEKK
jgi:hyperosmotically inducible protein